MIFPIITASHSRKLLGPFVLIIVGPGSFLDFHRDLLSVLFLLFLGTIRIPLDGTSIQKAAQCLTRAVASPGMAGYWRMCVTTLVSLSRFACLEFFQIILSLHRKVADVERKGHAGRCSLLEGVAIVLEAYPKRE